MTDTAPPLSAARRELLERRLRAAARERAAAGRIVPRERATADLPASFAQQRLWFLDQWAPARSTYTIPYRLRLTGALDVAALDAALAAVVDRHEVLRTTFAGSGGVPLQVVGAPGGFRLSVTDLGALGPAEREREAERLALAEATAPFDLAAGPLVRGSLLRLGPDEHLLLLTLHHTVSDGWSFRVLFEELNVLYTAFDRGEASPLPPLELQYGDFAVWERRRARDGAHTADLDYWTARLADAPMAEFPTDHPRPRELSGRGRRLLLSWDGDLARRAADHARASGATLYMLLVAGLAGLLQRHNGVGDQVFGAAVAGRTRAETEGLIGLFVNTLALRIDTGDDPTLETLVQRARSAAIEAFAHQDVPFDRIVEALRLPRETNRNPLFQVMISMQNLSHTPKAALHEVDVTIGTVDLDIAKFDLTFIFSEGEDRIGLEVEYSTDLFREDTVRRLADRFERLLEAIVSRPELRLSEVSVLSEEERRELFELSAPAPAELPEESVTAAFARWAAATPDRTAASFDGRTLSYAELDAWANRLAHRLLAHGIGRGARVGLCAPRSVELVVGMLAIARTGAAYVPLDPANPAERLAYMLADAEVEAVLYEPGVAAAVPEGTFLRLPLDPAEDQPADPPAVTVGPDDLLYVIYTSGSTGRPKGVCIPHRAVMALVWQADYVRLTPADVIGQASNASFDVATFEVWGALCNGALVVGVPKEVLLSGPALRAHIAEHGITVMNVPSSLLSVLAQETPDVFRGLDTLLFGGEAADPAAVAAVLRHPPGRMLNVYGPTETTTFSVAGLIRSVADGDQSVPLGRPISHMWVYVFDADGALAPPGATGELWVGGAGLAHGYWNRPELTAQRFTEDPFRPGERVYRTGDLGRWRPDGELEFCGRIDDQVKIRGYRVEPGEIATVLAEHPGVREAVVVVRSDAGGPARLVAYAVPSGAGVDAAELRRFAAERLPEFMVPAAVLLMERLPLNANDKVDKTALPAPSGGEGGQVEYLAPRTGTESALAEIWCEVLGCARVGARDDFFALGGHSLLVTQVVSRVESRLGVRIPLRAVFEAPVLERLAALVDERTAGGEDAREIVRVPRDGALPLSFAQQRLWFLDRLVPDSSSYTMPDAFRVRGALDLAALQSAVDTVVARHESLRTTFTEQDGTPCQIIHPRVEVPVRTVDATDREDATARAAAESQAPFDLERGPLMRVLVVRLAADESWLLLTLHHIIADGWSVEVLLDELSRGYAAAVAGDRPELPELPVQYADFAAWQRDWLREDVLEEQRAYWARALAGIEPLELPLDRPRPAVQSHRGATLEFTVDPATADRLRTLAREGNATLFMTLLSAFTALLSRLSGQDDIAVGYPIANRNHPATERIIGFFVNTLVLRTDLSDDPSFTTLLNRVRDTALSDYTHQDLPFEHLVELLQPERDLSRNPLAQVTFQLLNSLPGTLSAEGLVIERQDAGTTSSQFDLSMDMVDEPEALWGWINYSTDLFDASTMERLIARFLRVLDAVATDPSTPVSALPLLDTTERHQVLEGFQPAALPVRPEAAHQLFEQHAARVPDSTALVFGEQRWTFAELNTRANRLAHRLIATGIGPDSRVVLCAERHPNVVAAILAVWKAGAAYVPLDPAHPVARLDDLVADAAPDVLLVDPAQAERLAPHPHTLLLDDTHADESDHNPNLPVHPSQLAYVIYTSGSTGKPKGVQIEHGSIADLRATLEHGFGIRPPADGGPALRVAHTAPFSFDASIEQLSWLLSGHELHLVPNDVRRDPEELIALIRSARLQVMDSTASQLELLVSLGLFGEREHRPELVMVGGEAISPALWTAMRGTTGTRFFNLYGPTECTVDATLQPVDLGGDQPSIGRPLPNTRVYVMDRHGTPAPLGVPGELWIGGAGVARGYWNRPELTAQRFTEDPFRPGERVYRTGDLGRWNPDGTLDFHGRIDDQVKIRGHRVELGEIAAVLAEHPGVREAVVVVRSDAGGPARLVAYAVPSGAGVDAAELRRFAAERLPEFMVPAAVLLMERLPLNANDKLDRRALPAPSADDLVDATVYVAPATATQLALAEIWCEVLGCARVGARDDFFALGGHSLLVTQVVSRVESRLGVRMPLRAVFEAPVLERLAALVDERTAGGEDVRQIVRVPRDGALPLSFAQQRLWFLDRLVPDSAFYHMPDPYRVRGDLDIAALQSAVDTVVARHESLRTTFTEQDGTPCQIIHPTAEVTVRVVEAPDEESARALAEAETLAPFDLARGPLMRVLVIRLAGTDSSLLLLTLHHIVSDGWSTGVLLDELSRGYAAAVAGDRPDLPELPVQYADFAAWQRDWLREDVLEEQRAYWARALAGIEPLELPLDRPRPAVQSHRGATLEFTVDPATADRLRTLAREGNATLFMTLLSAFTALLSRLSGQDDIAVGYPIANRNHPATERIIGFFVNTLVLRTDLSDDPSFTTLLNRVRDTALSDYTHQDLPFEHLVELLQPERDLSRNPLAQVTFQLVNAADPAIELAGCEVERFEQVEQTNRFDLSMDVVDEPEALWGWINYSTDLFDASTMERLIARFLRVLDTVATDPSTPVSALPLLDATERHQVLEGFQPAALPVRPEAAHQLFEQHAARVPDSTALVFGEQRWTFAELNTRANRLAHRLIATGIGPDSRVALCAERHPNVVAAILAVWKAGAAYVPLDPAHPVARLDDLVADAAPDVLLVDPAQAERLAPHPHTLLLDDTHADESDHNPNLPVHPSQLAYVIYTSGSTGKPKGVQIEHGSLANLIAAERPRPAGDPSRPVRAAHTAPFGFDASVDQLCWLLNGHELHLVPDEVRRDTHALAALVREQAVDVLSVTPAQLELLLSLGLFGEHDGHRPEFVMVGGEAISPALWTAMRGTTGTRFFNLYGPTECTVDTTLHLLDTTRDRPSIGRPLPNTRVYVMDRHGTPAPLGVPGELWIGGAGVARGYWNRPELTAQRFTEDPFLPAERVYRTGDLGRWNPDGTLDFHGRIDDQVKIRGHRVEPGEVAAVLAEHPGVREAAVIARSDDGQPARLLAYAVPAARGADEAPATTRDKVEQWRDVFQTTHAEAGTADATFDIAGWTSSYTGGPIPAEEMRDWVDETVARIRALRPRRVLEIGAGTGLLLWRLAPQCERYVGTDFSASTLAGLAARLADRPIDGVELVHREANDLTGFEPGSFDCVVVNSVVQYFPHEAYLREVLAGARALLAPGGRIFVGDVRHLGLLDSFHHGVALARLGDGSPRRLHQDFLRRREQEGELVLSPAWFEEFAAQERLPGITVAPKAGRFDNELSRYRYDVVLSTDPADAARPADPAGATDPSGPARPAEGWRDWVAERLTLAEAEALLARDGLLRLTRVPNALVAGSAREAALLLGEDVAPGATVEAVRPVDLAELAARHGLEVALSWRADHPEGAFDAVLGGAPEDRRFPAPEARPAAGRTANDPVSTESSAVLGQELREYLAARLPEYLVPQAVVCLPALPLTVNGKLKKDELPVPGVAVGSVAPSTPVQELLATVWGEVLHLTGVGVRDNFFDLGGNSLVATRVIARAAQAGIRIGLRDVFQHQTIEELATACRPARPGKDD